MPTSRRQRSALGDKIIRLSFDCFHAIGSVKSHSALWIMSFVFINAVHPGKRFR